MVQKAIDACAICSRSLDDVMQDVFDTRFGIDRTYSIGRCGPCGIEQTQPAPSAPELKELYERYYNYGGERGTRYTDLRARFLASPLYRLWLHIDGDIAFHTRRGSGRLLDVGCNEGRGLRLYRTNGFAVEGLELNETAAAAARSQGFTVYSELLEQVEPGVSYDVIVLSNVLEHSLDPKGMLFHVRRLLKPGGEVWISCPNSRSWLRSLFGKYWINWHVPFHIVHFSPDGLRSLLSAAGFAVREVRQETPALWAAHSVIARLFSRRGRATKELRNPVLILFMILAVRLFLFPLLWAGNRSGRGDCLVVTARKQ